MKKTKPRFIRASGAPFSDEDIQLIGTELRKIAEANRVDDIRLLDKNLVFAAIEADHNHPLRRFYNWNINEVARKYWINVTTHKLIMSVRIEWGVGKFTRPLPITLSADLPRVQHGTVRKRVLTEDALLNDPVFASAVGIQIRSIDQQLARLESLVEAYGGGATLGVDGLLQGLRNQFDAYYSALKAAE